MNWSCRIQREYSRLGVFSFSVVIVGEGQGLDPSMNSTRSYPISTTWNWNRNDVQLEDVSLMKIWVVVLIEIREELLSKGLIMVGEVWLEEEANEL